MLELYRLSIYAIYSMVFINEWQLRYTAYETMHFLYIYYPLKFVCG